jgi:hypothetical protein
MVELDFMDDFLFFQKKHGFFALVMPQ